ncbi:MAG: VOC family protein [Balneolales bacterium]|nr:VOC family protein [Balneolales bacterium]
MSTGKHPVVRFEIGCSNRSETLDFYEACFDWKISKSEIMDEIAANGDTGIPGHITSLVTELDHHLLFYIQVDDINDTLKRVEHAGGSIKVPPVTLPSGQRFAWFNDVAGNTVGIITKEV